MHTGVYFTGFAKLLVEAIWRFVSQFLDKLKFSEIYTKKIRGKWAFCGICVGDTSNALCWKAPYDKGIVRWWWRLLSSCTPK